MGEEEAQKFAEELEATRPADPLTSLTNLAGLGMKQMTVLHPELTFHMGLTALKSLMTEEEKDKMDETAKSKEGAIVKFIKQEELFYEVLDRLGVGFRRKQRTMYDDLKDRMEDELDRQLTKAVSSYCDANGLEMPNRKEIRVVPI